MTADPSAGVAVTVTIPNRVGRSESGTPGQQDYQGLIPGYTAPYEAPAAGGHGRTPLDCGCGDGCWIGTAQVVVEPDCGPPFVVPNEFGCAQVGISDITIVPEFPTLRKGSKFQVQVTVENLGPSPATQVQFVCGVEGMGSSGSGAMCDKFGSCTVGVIEPGRSTRLTYTMSVEIGVPSDLPHDLYLLGSCRVQASETDPDPSDNRTRFDVIRLAHLGPGDVDGEVGVSVGDVIMALHFLLGDFTPSPDQLTSADVRPKRTGGHGDGRIGADDVNWILRKALGLEGEP